MKTILATTDFSKASVNAVRYAAQLSIESSGKLLLLHSTFIPVVSDSFFDMRITLDALEKDDETSLKNMCEQLQNEFGSDLKIDKKNVVGYTDQIIKDLISSGGISMIVMGIQHTDKLSQAIFGTSSTKLAGTVSCPILIIPETMKFKPWKKIAFAFNQVSAPMNRGVKVLKELATLFNSKIQFINIMENEYIQKDDSMLEPLYKTFKDLELKTYFEPSKPNMTSEILMDWVRRHKAGVIVLVARHHSILWKLFNERMTKKIAFHSKVPILILSEK
jgi:nucleotide-binding universal stress UspA family protein